MIYLGWKPAEELLEYLCAGDLYCQPGSVSATLQNALCCGCPAMAYPHEEYRDGLDWGQFLWVRTREDMRAAIEEAAREPGSLAPLRQRALACARELLDYRVLAARLYR